MSKFLSDPRPEKIEQVCFSVPDQGAVLTVGVQLVTETIDGLKIVPTKAVGFAIGPKGDEEANIIDVPVKLARELARQLYLYCDAIEAERGQLFVSCQTTGQVARITMRSGVR